MRGSVVRGRMVASSSVAKGLIAKRHFIITHVSFQKLGGLRVAAFDTLLE